MIRKIWFKDYRNLKEIIFEFGLSDHVVIFGDNNQGKSNFLEGIYVASCGDTPMHHDLESVVNSQSDLSMLGLDFLKDSEEHRLYVKIFKDGKKTYQYQQKEIKTLKSFKKDLLIEFLSADVLRLLQDEPECRRKELDRFCTILFPQFLLLSSNYSRVLKQKNHALKQEEGLDYMDVWNRQLSDLADQIVALRKQAIVLIERHVKQIADTLSLFFSDTISLSYSVSRIEGLEKGYKQAFYEQMTRDREKERLLGYSLSGPQKDDFLIKVSDQSIQQYYSRGINRMAAILFKMGQWCELQVQTGRFPMLLLDDVFSELDKKNRGVLIQYLNKKTSIVYATVQKEDCNFFDSVRVYQMKSGELLRV